MERLNALDDNHVGGYTDICELTYSLKSYEQTQIDPNSQSLLLYEDVLTQILDKMTHRSRNDDAQCFLQVQILSCTSVVHC